MPLDTSVISRYKGFLAASVKLEHRCDLPNEDSPYKYVNETMDPLILETLELFVPTRLVRVEVQSSLYHSYSLCSMDSIVDREKQSVSAVSFTGSESLLLIMNWTSDETALDDPMQAPQLTPTFPYRSSRDCSTSPTRSLSFFRYRT